MSKRGWKPVTETYFGQGLGNTQDPDEPYDHTMGTNRADGTKIGGMGSQGGGSKAPSQRKLLHLGSGSLHGSAPTNRQKIRG